MAKADPGRDEGEGSSTTDHVAAAGWVDKPESWVHSSREDIVHCGEVSQFKALREG